MKLFRSFAAAAFLCLGVAACGTFAGGGGSSAPSPAILKSAKAVLTVYGEVYQPAVLFYGRLPDCPQAVVCKDRPVLDKLKAVDLATTKAITAAQPVLNGQLPDGGQVADALAAVAAAQTQIAASGALKLH